MIYLNDLDDLWTITPLTVLAVEAKHTAYVSFLAICSIRPSQKWLANQGSVCAFTENVTVLLVRVRAISLGNTDHHKKYIASWPK